MSEPSDHTQAEVGLAGVVRDQAFEVQSALERLDGLIARGVVDASELTAGVNAVRDKLTPLVALDPANPPTPAAALQGAVVQEGQAGAPVPAGADAAPRGGTAGGIPPSS